MAANKGTCLVTGVSGFVGLHVAKAALEAGYTVRGTVRSIAKHREAIDSVLGTAPAIELVEVELTSLRSSEDSAWVKAAEGCVACCHVASPFPIVAPKDENELIKPVRGVVAVTRGVCIHERADVRVCMCVYVWEHMHVVHMCTYTHCT